MYNLEDLFTDKSYKCSTYKYKTLTQEICVLETASTDYDLTGQILWPASDLLSRYIFDNSQHFLHKTILELGAGGGLPGLVATQYADVVIATDNEPIVLDLLKENYEKYKGEDVKQVHIAKFDWGVDKLSGLEKWDNLKDEDNIGNYLSSIDIVMGSDIVYDSGAIPLLFRTINDILEMNPEAIVLIAGKIRNMHAYNTLLSQTEINGFELIHKSQNIITEMDPNLFLFQFVKKPL